MTCHDSNNIPQAGEEVSLEVEYQNRELLISQKQTALLCLCFKEDVTRL